MSLCLALQQFKHFCLNIHFSKFLKYEQVDSLPPRHWYTPLFSWWTSAGDCPRVLLLLAENYCLSTQTQRTYSKGADDQVKMLAMHRDSREQVSTDSRVGGGSHKLCLHPFLRDYSWAAWFCRSLAIRGLVILRVHWKNPGHKDKVRWSWHLQPSMLLTDIHFKYYLAGIELNELHKVLFGRAVFPSLPHSHEEADGHRPYRSSKVCTEGNESPSQISSLENESECCVHPAVKT